jgi:ParB family chromosome partitioning protein
VPCRIIPDDDVALEASTAENTLREAMHPADQFIAFKGMTDAGKSIVDVAAHFGIDERVVKQRLKLANVDPQLVQIYRDGGMSLEQLQALALTDDHEAQRKAWFGPKESYQRGAYALREALTKGDVPASNSIARMVGLEAYQAAGGEIRRDLFATRDEVSLCDRQLLSKLAIAKLEDLRKAELAAGWSWAEAHTALDHAQEAAYGRLDAIQAEEFLPDDLQARLDVIESRIDEIEAIDGDSLEDAASEALADELQNLEDEREEIHEQTQQRWPVDAMAKSGVLIFIRGGEVLIERGRLQPGQKFDKAGTVTGTAKPSVASNKATPTKSTLSIDMVQRLGLHRAAAIRSQLSAKPEIAHALLITHLVTNLLTTVNSSLLDLRAINVHARTGAGTTTAKDWADVTSSKARKQLDADISRLKQLGLPKKGAEVYAWVSKLGFDDFEQVAATCTALMLENINFKEGAALAELLGIDMAQWWQADAAHYIAQVPKALVLEAILEVHGKDSAAKLANLKKDALVAEAGKLLANTGWLPKPLRGPKYALKKPATGKAPAAKKVATKKKKPAKKSVKS